MTDPRVEAAARAICSEIFCMDWNNADASRKDECMAAGLAALTAADASAWWPMSEAPRDGTLMLVSVKHIGCDVVSWWGAGWRETTNGLALRDEPTHWQPLPAPPKDEVKE